MRLVVLGLCLTLVGCGGNGAKSSFPTDEQFKALQSQLATTRATKTTNTPRNGTRDSYLLKTHHEKWTVSEAATYALVRIGQPAVAQLRQELKAADAKRKLRAIDILARIGPDAKDAVPDLITMLQSGNERVKKYAARALGQIGPDAGAAVPQLIKALNQ